MTDPQDADLARAVHDAWDGSLRLVHITVSDEDGDGYPGLDVDRWVIDVRVPLGDDEAEAASVAQVVAFTIRDPEDVDGIAAAFQVSDTTGGFAEAVAVEDPDGGAFHDLFDSAADLLGKPDLLAIDAVTVRPEYASLPGLVTGIVSGVRGGPAGRGAAFVLVDPTAWNVPLTDDDRTTASLAEWGDTTVLASMNADPEDAYRIAQDAVSGRLDGSFPGLPAAGARVADLWLEETVRTAEDRPALAVPFTLPPALPAHIWAGAPEDVHDVRVDEATGAIVIETHDVELEVVGMPGNAPQLVGPATEASDSTQAWLRAVHERWWTYQPALHDQVHEVIDAFLEGRLDTVLDETTPHLHVPDLDRGALQGAGAAAMHLEPVGEDDDPLVFDVVLDAGAGGHHEHIGAVLVHDSGHVRGFLHDEWQPKLPDHERTLQSVLALGAEEYFAAVLHDVLDEQVIDVILTGDVHGH